MPSQIAGSPFRREKCALFISPPPVAVTAVTPTKQLVSYEGDLHSPVRTTTTLSSALSVASLRPHSAANANEQHGDIGLPASPSASETSVVFSPVMRSARQSAMLPTEESDRSPAAAITTAQQSAAQPVSIDSHTRAKTRDGGCCLVM
jgi:hypothetical protein